MRKRTQQARNLACALLVIGSCVVAQELALETDGTWLPARCVPLDTIGLHDGKEESGEPKESFEPARFERRSFTLRSNDTFAELLAEEEQVDRFVTMTIDELNDVFEFSCREVMGVSRELGFSCLNTPPSDILMINPKSMRYSRAAIGTWTFQSDAGILDGSSLFVELGQCYLLEPSSDSN